MPIIMRRRLKPAAIPEKLRAGIPFIEERYRCPGLTGAASIAHVPVWQFVDQAGGRRNSAELPDIQAPSTRAGIGQPCKGTRSAHLDKHWVTLQVVPRVHMIRVVLQMHQLAPIPEPGSLFRVRPLFGKRD